MENELIQFFVGKWFIYFMNDDKWFLYQNKSHFWEISIDFQMTWTFELKKAITNWGNWRRAMVALTNWYWADPSNWTKYMMVLPISVASESEEERNTNMITFLKLKQTIKFAITHRWYEWVIHSRPWSKPRHQYFLGWWLKTLNGFPSKKLQKQAKISQHTRDPLFRRPVDDVIWRYISNYQTFVLHLFLKIFGT